MGMDWRVGVWLLLFELGAGCAFSPRLDIDLDSV